MRILGWIVGLSVVLLLTGLFMFQTNLTPTNHGGDSSYLDQAWGEAAQSGKNENMETVDSTWNFSTWKLLPVGLVRYPDFGPLDFLKRAK